ncbi:MAG: GIY-YIG nuclease family protein [Saprospiraceae bacterium]|nr:GIY-YIG nuclease family protein [Saprospiraceae bacterium]
MESPYYVYAIYSKSRNYIYVGISNDVQRRLSEHNLGYNKTTKPYRPFILIYDEEFDNRSDARQKEKYLKGGSGRKFLRKRIIE